MLALNDAEFAAVMQAAGPIHPLQRDAFLKALAVELELLSRRRSWCRTSLRRRAAEDLRRGGAQ